MDVNCNLSSFINDFRLLLVVLKFGGDFFCGGSCNGWVFFEELCENSCVDI